MGWRFELPELTSQITSTYFDRSFANQEHLVVFQNLLTMKGNPRPIGLGKALVSVVKTGTQTRVLASLITDAFGASTDVGQRFVVPAINAAPLLMSRYISSVHHYHFEKRPGHFDSLIVVLSQHM